MKFAVVVVLFALALGTQSSVVPVVVHDVHAPVLIQHAVHTVVAHPPAAIDVHAAIHSAPVHIVSAPVVVPHVVAVAPAEGTYIAKTRGAVHIAPLPGHVNSAASVNLEPAPGTV